MSVRAQAPAAPPLPFAAPKMNECRRSSGHVQVPDPSTEEAGPLAMSWKMACAGALEDQHAHPPKLRRTSSVAGNVLVVETPDDANMGPRRAFWLQRKIHEETHTNNYVRIGFPLAPVSCDGETMGGIWEVKQAAAGSMYPFEMVAMKVQDHSYVYADDSSDTPAPPNGDDSASAATAAAASSNSDQPAVVERKIRSKHALNEIAASQLVKAADPDGKGNVISAELVASDDIQVYIIMPFCKEGSLLDCVSAESVNGRLEESRARAYFSQILNGLATLQKVQLCHRNLSLENVLMRGSECHITSLGWSLRVPTTVDGDSESPAVNLIEPQLTCGRKPQYVAPEVFRNEPFDGYAVDLWAAGVILYVMLLGPAALFSAPIPEDPKFYEMCVLGHLKPIVEKMQGLPPECGGDDDSSTAKPISGEAIDLLQSMLRAEPTDRLTLAQVKDHPWLKANAST